MNTIPANETADRTDIVTFWVSADGQGSIDMTGATAAEALAELLAQCGEDDQRDAILAGAFQVAE